jgi:hypothetical protein
MSGRTNVIEPIPPSNQRTKEVSWMTLVKDPEKGWIYKKTFHTKNYDMVLRRWIRDESKTRTEYLSLESRGVSKKQRIKVLVTRTGFDPVNVRNYSKTFIVELEATVPAIEEYEAVFLTVVRGGKRGRRRVDGHFVINDFSGQVFGFQKLDWSSKWIKRLPKEIPVTPKQAQAMLDSGEAAKLFAEGSTGQIVSDKNVVSNVRI